MNHLPDSLMLRIFAHLSMADLGRAATVCRTWRRITYDPSIWRSVNLEKHARSLDDKSFQLLVRTRLGLALRHLNLSNCAVTSKMLRQLSKSCKNLLCVIFGKGSKFVHSNDEVNFPPNLELLELRPARGDFSFLKRIPRHFTKLRYLGIGSHSSKGSVPRMFVKMQNLTILDCTNCEAMKDEHVQTIAMCCPKLESFCLNGCKNIYGTTFDELLRKCGLLRTLLLRYTPIRDSCFDCPLWAETKLEEIDISACTHLTRTGLVRLLTQIKSFRYLNLSYCGIGRAVTDSVLIAMVSYGSCAKIEMLDIRWSMNITPHVLREFLKSCPLLKCLGIYQSSHINCSAMADLLDCVPRLEILEFGAFGKASISESFLFPNLVRHCPRLRALSLINFLSLNPYSDGQLFGRLLSGCLNLERINLCEPDPTLTSLVGSIRVTTTAKITQRWQCVLPAPDVTLDAVMNQLCYLW